MRARPRHLEGMLVRVLLTLLFDHCSTANDCGFDHFLTANDGGFNHYSTANDFHLKVF